jgi:uncharacterized integral membrane protein
VNVRKSNDDTPEEKGSRVSPRLIAIVILAVLAVIFVLQNTHGTRVSFLFFHIQWGLWIILLLCVVIGVVIGWLVGRKRE